jgi:hypothetical protein
MLAENLSVFFDATSAGFATSATLPGGAVVPVVFDNAYLSGLGGMIESNGPQLMGKTSDLAALAHGDTVTISAAPYTVTGIQPDGTGVTMIQLRG